MITYFRKTLLSNNVALSSGKRLIFDPIGDDEGVIALDDGPLIEELRTLSSKQIGGVSEIDEAEYHDLKKKAEPDSRKRPSLTDPPQWPQARLDFRGTQDVVAAEAPVKAEAVIPPSEPAAPDFKNLKAAIDPTLNRPQPRKVHKPSVLV